MRISISVHWRFNFRYYWWKEISIKEVKQDKILTKIEELEAKQFEERLSIEGDIIEVLEEAQEENMELIGENDKNYKLNTVKD